MAPFSHEVAGAVLLALAGVALVAGFVGLLMRRPNALVTGVTAAMVCGSLGAVELGWIHLWFIGPAQS